MAFRHTHAKDRNESDRLKDIPKAPFCAQSPRKERLARRAVTAGLRAWLAAQGADKDTVTIWLQRFRALCRDLPRHPEAAGPPVSVCDHVAARVRHTFTAEALSKIAMRLGLDTNGGAKANEAALQASKAAQASAVCAFGMAARMAGATPAKAKPGADVEANRRRLLGAT